MKIVYLYMNMRGIRQKIEYNLGSHFHFSYDSSKNIVEAKPNEMFVNNFFTEGKNNSFLEINAIVGENGTGKTTILEGIRDILARKYTEDFIIIIEQKGIYQCNTNLNCKVNGLEVDYIKRSLQKINRIYYSNVFDARYFSKSPLDHNSYLDLTTNTMLSKAGNTYWYFTKELAEQIKFIKDFKKTGFSDNFKFPQNIELRLNGKSSDSKLFLGKTKLRKSINKFCCKKIANILFKNFIFKGEKRENDLQNLFFRQILYFYFYEIETFLFEKFPEQTDLTSLGTLFELFSNTLINLIEVEMEKNQYDLNGLNQVLLNNLANTSNQMYKYKFNYKELESFLDTLQLNVDKLLRFSVKKENYNVANLSINFNLNELNEDVFDILERWKLYGIGGLIWTELSSGEYAFISMFSRLYQASLKFNQFDKQRLTVILIDEGELYFHPQWQKSWIRILIEGLQIIFSKENHSIQVILTTHSPFVLSDIPNDRILFLKKNRTKNQIECLNRLEDIPYTFAANIHNLYSNSFFLSEGLIGDFSRYKIDNLVDEILNTTPEYVQKHSIRLRNTINLIGEPLLKGKIIEMYQQQISLLKPTHKQVKEEIENLNNRIEFLEQMMQKGFYSND